MIGQMLALLLAAAETQPPSAPATPTTAAETSPAPMSPLEAARDNTERLEQLFEQSCGVRAYAAYDDICAPLADQVHSNRVVLDRLEREAARHPKSASTTNKSNDAPPR